MALREPEAQASRLPELDDETYRLVQRLFQVVRAGDTAQVGRLLEMGLVPNLRDGKGDSLLMLAAYHEHESLVRVLMANGADPGLANDRGQIPLQAVAFRGDPDVARALLAGGADVDGQGADGKTPLMYAAMFDRIPMIELLLEQGADPTHQSADGMTAQTLARMMGAKAAEAHLAQMSKKAE